MYPNLKLQLWKMGMRQNRLAQSLGMDETLLSKIVNGFREPNGDVRERIAGLLQSDAAWLFDRASVREPAETTTAEPSRKRMVRNGSRVVGK
jgi:transcriptional regulator with XRE-family HTH domain